MAMFALQLTVVLYLAASSNALNEPVCSRFEYDVQTLKAMLKVENKVEIFEEKLRQWEKSIETRFDKFNENRVSDINMLQKEVEDRTNAIETKLQDSQRKFATKMHDDAMTMMSMLNSTMEDFVADKRAVKRNSGQQVAFTAHGATGKAVNTVLTFGQVILNKGSGYDRMTGIFTCPVAGTYLFSATLLSVGSRSGETYCYIRKNGSNIALVDSYEGKHDSASVSVILHLSVGDLVELGSCGNVKDILTTSGRSLFIGSLIQAD